MKNVRTALALPFIATGLGILSIGSAVFCTGCWLAEMLPTNTKFLKKKQ